MAIIGVLISALSFVLIILECRIRPFNSTRHVSAWHYPVPVFQIMDRAKKKAE